MTMLFYRHEDGGIGGVSRNDVVVRWWRPASDGFPWGSAHRNGAWWALARLGLFARDGFAALSLWRSDTLVHRLIVTPRWYRFPFMDTGDLQIGDLWTHPEARRQGLARHAIGEVHRMLAAPGTRFWYVVDSGNRASVRLIETCGYRLVGTGRRTAPFGLRALGRFVVEQTSALSNLDRGDRAGLASRGIARLDDERDPLRFATVGDDEGGAR